MKGSPDIKRLFSRAGMERKIWAIASQSKHRILKWLQSCVWSWPLMLMPASFPSLYCQNTLWWKQMTRNAWTSSPCPERWSEFCGVVLVPEFSAFHPQSETLGNSTGCHIRACWHGLGWYWRGAEPRGHKPLSAGPTWACRILSVRQQGPFFKEKNQKSGFLSGFMRN